MSSLTDYIALIGIVYLPIACCGSGISDAREQNKSVNFVIAFVLFANVCLGLLTPWLSVNLLNGKVYNRIIFSVYLGGNLLVHLRFMHKKLDGNFCFGKCRFFKDIWIFCVILYTLLLVYCLHELNDIIIVLAAVLYVVYNSCLLGFDYYFKEEPKEWEEVKYELAPLKQISIGCYREWAKKRDVKIRRGTMLLAAVYQGVLVAVILAAAQRITLLAVLIILLFYFLTLGSLAMRWNKRIKDIETRPLESVYRGKAVIETISPIRVKYMDFEGEFQSCVVEKLQRKKYKKGIVVDIVMENGEVVLAEKNLAE